MNFETHGFAVSRLIGAEVAVANFGCLFRLRSSVIEDASFGQLINVSLRVSVLFQKTCAIEYLCLFDRLNEIGCHFEFNILIGL